jgi:pyruvate formate lyase activating enzyme
MSSVSGQCRICGKESRLIPDVLSVCVECIRAQPGEALPPILQAHGQIRREFDLPGEAPRSAAEDGVECPLCVNACRLGEGEIGLCGVRTARDGRLIHMAGTPRGAMVSWYDDPLPTNCVADWVCEGSQQRGKVNLAVFYEACTFNCVSCQNWHFRLKRPPGRVSAEQLAAQAHRRTFCVCYFGGDPTPQMPHALATSRLLAERGITVCWETNGSMHSRLLDRAVELSLRTGGCIKFDLKAFDENLHLALTGVSNRRTLENFRRAAKRITEQPDLREGRGATPLVVASTLLVPGYVDAREVSRIASFIAEADPQIPYALLGFHPHFFIPDLPRTSLRHAEEAEAAARAAGLTRVRIGNRHLLSRDY